MRSTSAAAAAVFALLLPAALCAPARAYEHIEVNYLLQRMTDGVVTTLGGADSAGRFTGVVKGPGRYTLRAVCRTEPCPKFTATLRASGGTLTPLPGGGWALTVTDKQQQVSLTGQVSFRVEGHIGSRADLAGQVYTAQDCAKDHGVVAQHEGAPGLPPARRDGQGPGRQRQRMALHQRPPLAAGVYLPLSKGASPPPTKMDAMSKPNGPKSSHPPKLGLAAAIALLAQLGLSDAAAAAETAAPSAPASSPVGFAPLKPAEFLTTATGSKTQGQQGQGGQGRHPGQQGQGPQVGDPGQQGQGREVRHPG